MTSHVHLLMTPEKLNAASTLLQSLGRRYVQYVNRFSKRSGTLWEGGFKESLVNAEKLISIPNLSVVHWRRAPSRSTTLYCALYCGW